MKIDLKSFFSMMEESGAKEIQSEFRLKDYRIEIKVTKLGNDGCEECAFEDEKIDSPYCKVCSHAHIDYWRPKE